MEIQGIIDQLCALPREEQARVHELLGERLAQKPSATDMEEAMLDNALVAEGVLAATATDQQTDDDFQAFQPIAVRGEPVSETILKERR